MKIFKEKAVRSRLKFVSFLFFIVDIDNAGELFLQEIFPAIFRFQSLL